jgi:hypothetical protein
MSCVRRCKNVDTFSLRMYEVLPEIGNIAADTTISSCQVEWTMDMNLSYSPR